MEIGTPIWYGDKSLEKAFRRAKRLGFDYVEVSLDYPWYPNRKLNELLMKLKEEYKLSLAFHLPILELNLCHPSNEISTPALKTCMKFLSSLTPLNPIYINLHFLALLLTQKFEEIWKEVIERAKEVAIELHKFSKSHGISLTFENGSKGGLRKISDFKFLPKRNLNLCLDLGHAVVVGYQENQKKLKMVRLLRHWVDKFREIIYVIHWHDVAMVKNEIRDHLVLGSGMMNLKEVASLIKEVDCEHILLECFYSLKGGKIVSAKTTDLKNNLKICRELLD